MTETKHTGAEYILKKLRLAGVKHIFGIPGKHMDPLYEAIIRSDIEPIVNCHELSAGYMAEGYSRAINKLGVLIGIGGPGANNMIAAVKNARIEKTPMLIITGDGPVCFSDIPTFQCTNEFGSNDDDIFKLITKFSKRISDIDDLVFSLDEAITISLSPPYGPTHLIVPHNVFTETTVAVPKPVDYNKLKYWEIGSVEEIVNRLKKMILSDKKVVFWIGGILNKKDQAKQIKDLAERFYIPVATSYDTKGVIPENHELALGNFGYAGSNLSREILFSEEAEIIIGFDIEQNERNTLNWDPLLYKGKEMILINFSGSYSNKKYGEAVHINPFYVLKSLHTSLMNKVYDNSDRKLWFEKALQNVNLKVGNTILSNTSNVEPSRLIHILQKKMPKESILFVDSGNHRIFPGIHWKAMLSESFYSAAAIAPMGWAIAAGIGCKFVRNEPVVIFTGDGCMQMHGIELKTAVRHNLAILVIIINNSALGSIHGRFLKISEEAAKKFEITEIDWNLFSKSLGAEVFEVTSEESFSNHINSFISNQKLTILNVRTPVAPYIHDLSLVKPKF